MKKKEIRVWYSEYTAITDLVPEQQEVVRAAEEASKIAYAPYSGFYVGAAVKLANGNIIKGNNQENAAYPSGICAERVAMWSAMANNLDTKIKCIAIVSVAKKTGDIIPVTPCGSCRQALLEYETLQGKPIQVIMYTKNRMVIVFDSIANLLPMQFDGKVLKGVN